jgi:hypothetical protein
LEVMQDHFRETIFDREYAQQETRQKSQSLGCLQ